MGNIKGVYNENTHVIFINRDLIMQLLTILPNQIHSLYHMAIVSQSHNIDLIVYIIFGASLMCNLHF